MLMRGGATGDPNVRVRGNAYKLSEWAVNGHWPSQNILRKYARGRRGSMENQLGLLLHRLKVPGVAAA